MENKILGQPPANRKNRSNVEVSHTVAGDDRHGTQHDKMDMDRMGKLQQLKVRS
jgi:hypothetical protein